MSIQKRFSFLFSCCIVLALSLWLWTPGAVHAIGLSPPMVEVDSLLRGTTQTRTVTLYRAPDDVGDVYIHVEPDAQHVEFFVLEGQEIVMLDGQNEISYTFGITPGSAANGAYELKLRFLKTGDPTKFSSGAGVSIVTGVTAQVLVIVGGEEQLEYALQSVYAQETEEGLDVPVFYSIDNTGNVDWRPQKIVFEFFDESGAIAGTYELSGSDIESVKAGQTGQTFEVRVPAVLVRGRYSVSTSFWYQDELIETLASAQIFDVFAPGTLAQSGTLKGLSVNKSAFTPGEQVKVSATFHNDGQIDTIAKLILEVSRDGEIIDLLRGEEFKVARAEEFVFSQLFKASDVGKYEISGYVEYAMRQTSTKQVSFEVQEAAAGIIPAGRFLNSAVGLVVLAVVLIAAVWFILFAVKRKRSADRSSSAPSVSVPTSQDPPPPHDQMM